MTVTLHHLLTHNRCMRCSVCSEMPLTRGSGAFSLRKITLKKKIKYSFSHCFRLKEKKKSSLAPEGFTGSFISILFLAGNIHSFTCQEEILLFCLSHLFWACLIFSESALLFVYFHVTHRFVHLFLIFGLSFIHSLRSVEVFVVFLTVFIHSDTSCFLVMYKNNYK